MRIIGSGQVDEIIAVLRAGQALVLPSETSYGLSCDAANQAAVEKIFAIKGRSEDKSLLVVMDSVKMAKKYLRWNNNLEKIANEFWKNETASPITAVGEYKKSFFTKQLAKGAVSAQNTLAVRVTKYPLLSALCRRLGRPLVSTSANLAGAENIYDSLILQKIFSNRPAMPDAIVDGGMLARILPTTIASVIGKEIEILRQGEAKI